MPSDAPHRDPIETLAAERERLRESHLDGSSGLEQVRALTAAVDAAVSALWSDIAGDRRGVALVALGGYGRGELSPHSDLDLMVLHTGVKGAADEARALFYRLWDAGFEVGHAVRSPAECLRLARENFEAETSFLDARRLSGDETLYQEFAAASVGFSRKRGAKFVAAARAAMEARHAKDGNASCLLEPDLKEGAGGLRDLHTTVWLDRLFETGSATEETGAASMLYRIRNHLHYEAARRQDVLLLHLQQPTAEALGWRAEEQWSVWDAFMRDVYRTTRAVEQRLARTLVELSGPRRRRSRAPVESASHASVRSLREAAEESFGDPWTPAMREAFFSLLRLADSDALRESDDAGALAAYLPEWDRVRNRPQHNVYHRFTVDIHAYETAAHLARLDARADEPLAARAAADVRDRDLLLLAGLLHDIGKGSDGDHSEVGAISAAGIASRAGFDRARTETVRWLVRNHLLLVDAATRRDISDEDLVVELAAQVGDPERLRMLYALSVADGLGTGATAWTSWKSTLVAELFSRMMHVLERGEVASSDARELFRLRTAELRRALSDRHPEDAIETHMHGMSRAYVLAFSTNDLIRHFALMAEPLATGDIRTHVAASGQPGLSDLTLVAADRPGLFSIVSGALALNGINVVSAQIHTRSDGAALEVFRVRPSMDSSIDENRWQRLFDDVRAALRGELGLERMISEKRAAYARRPAKTRPRDPVVVVANDASDFYTVIEVHALDRLGVLYAITRVLAEAGLDIHLAKVATYGEEVVDSFYVRQAAGEKLEAPDLIAALERSILGAVAVE